MPRGKRLFKLIVARVRGGRKGTTYTRSFKSQADMTAYKARIAKRGKPRPTKPGVTSERPRVAGRGQKTTATPPRADRGPKARKSKATLGTEAVKYTQNDFNRGRSRLNRLMDRLKKCI